LKEEKIKRTKQNIRGLGFREQKKRKERRP
jgi:hypothetical protein